MVPAAARPTATNCSAWTLKNNKWFSHPSHHRYIHWVWVGFATCFISRSTQWSCKWQYRVHQNSHAVKITLKLWYKSIFSFHQNIQDVSSYLCYMLFLTCGRWQILKGKSNQAVDVASWDRHICSHRSFFFFLLPFIFLISQSLFSLLREMQGELGGRRSRLSWKSVILPLWELVK